jgi:flagellar hook-associated protein 2
MSDYSMLGSFSTGNASQLNGELIDKLKNAEKHSVLSQIDKDLEKITGVDAETGDSLDKLGESDKFALIKAQVMDLQLKIGVFDLNSSSTTAFDAVSASTTGTAAVFDAVDVSGLDEGTTNITVTQLAQRDVYQSVTFTQADREKGLSILSVDADADGNDLDGSGVANDSDEDYSDADLELIKSSKLSVKVGDTTYDFNVYKDLSVDKVSELQSKSIDELAAEINENENLIASIENVGDDKYKLVIKSKESGLANDVTISQTNINLGFLDSVKSKDVTKTDTIDANSVLILNGHEFTGNEVHTYGMSGSVDDGSSDDGDATTVDFLGHSVNTTQGDTAEQFVQDILSQKTDIISTWNDNNSDKEIKDIIASTDDSTKVVIIFDSSATDVDPISTADSNGIDFDDNSVEKRDYDSSFTYEDLTNQIDNESGFSASFEDDDGDGVGKIKISSNSDLISINETDLDLDLDYASHIQTAQNLKAVIDGVDYNVSSNDVTIQGNLKMTAVEVGDASINITKDTTAIMEGASAFIESYNSLYDAINEEAQDPLSPMRDISGLKSILSSVKEQLFGNFGENNDLNLFNFGLDLDIKGHLSLDSEKFGDALTEHYDDVKNLFMGNTTDEELATSDSTKYLGMGTQIAAYLEQLDSTDGFMTRYQDSIDSRKEKLEKEREDALSKLDLKYETLAKQFSDYGAIITQMEQSFSGLEMMIKQSIASK